MQRMGILLGGSVVALALCFSAAPAPAQSFNCRYARSADEVLICQDARLAALDDRLASLYAEQRLRLSGARRAALERDEGAWLQRRRACGRERACIARLYAQRIRQLSVAARMPQRVGACVTTTIAKIGTRFGSPLSQTAAGDSSGTAVEFSNGGFQISYDWEATIARSRVGDPVRLCLKSIPQNCPPGDERGRTYTTTNLRTGEAWTLSDSQHMCGGA